MSPLRKTALVAGVFYLITFVSIPTLFLYTQVLHNAKYILGPGPDAAVLFGGISEIIVALAGVGTAIALYPVLKRQSEGRALGFYLVVKGFKPSPITSDMETVKPDRRIPGAAAAGMA